jgi:DNA-binding Lrp family transcriptional regulator
MQMLVQQPTATTRYAKAVENSKRMRFDIDRDVIRGRRFDFAQKFLPDGLSKVDSLNFLTADEQRLLSQIQGRSYANIFGLVERFIAAKVLEVSREHWLGDQTALEALVRFSDEEIKHQEMFRRIERMIAEGMPEGYTFLPDPNAVAKVVLGKSTWAVLGLTCHIELFVLAHYRESIDPDPNLSELWKDVFLYHWREESQHAILDELEWAREDAKLTPAERDQAVNELIELVGAVDGILQQQAAADTDYFIKVCGGTRRAFAADEIAKIRAGVLSAYRWQYIISGVQGRFSEVLGRMINPAQAERIGQALAPIMR